MIDELGGNIMKKFVGYWANTYRYVMTVAKEKKQKAQKMCYKWKTQICELCFYSS